MEQTDIYYNKVKAHIQKTISINAEEFEYVSNHFTIEHLKREEYLIKPQQVSRYESFIANGLFQLSISIEISGIKR